METSELLSYALWFSIRRQRAQKMRDALDLLRSHLNTQPLWRLCPRPLRGGEGVLDTNIPSLHMEVAPDFHFLHIEQHCSAGDICGSLKYKVLEESDTVMAVCITRESHRYIPHQGLPKDG